MPYAEVAVNAAAPIRQTFTYRVPDELTVAVGQAVYVPFGARTLQGIVAEITAEPRFQDRSTAATGGGTRCGSPGVRTRICSGEGGVRR